MRGRGGSAAVFALSIGVVLAGGVALRPVEQARSAAIVDTTPTEALAASVTVAEPMIEVSAPAPVVVEEVLPTPVVAPASAA